MAFGLLGIAAKEVTKKLLHLEEQHEGLQQDVVEATDESTDGVVIKKVTIDADDSANDELSEKIVKNAESKSNMCDMELYQLTLWSLLWQHNNYLVGHNYADE